MISDVICVKDEPGVNESPRPNSSQPVGHYDPLDLDTEDLFVKYKVPYIIEFWFLADRTIGRAFGTLCRLSVCLSSVCDVLYCGEMVRPN